MAEVIERKRGRRRGPGPAKGGGQPLAILSVVLVVAAVLTAYFLLR